MSRRSRERREVMVIGGGIAAGTASMALIADRHPVLAWIWMGVIGVALVYVCARLVKMKRGRR